MLFGDNSSSCGCGVDDADADVVSILPRAPSRLTVSTVGIFSAVRERLSWRSLAGGWRSRRGGGKARSSGSDSIRSGRGDVEAVTGVADPEVSGDVGALEPFISRRTLLVIFLASKLRFGTGIGGCMKSVAVDRLI